MPAERPPTWQRTFAIAFALTLVLSACSVDATIAIDRQAASPADPDVSPGSGTDDGGEAGDEDPPPQSGNDVQESADAANDEPDGVDNPSPESAADDEPNYVVQGQLPLEVAEVNELIAFVESETGRLFLRPPTIVAQSTEVFFANLEEDLAEFDETADITVRTMQALGLTSLGVDEVNNAIQALLASPSGVAGYYDPDVDELYVPIDAQAEDEFRSLLVHELTHALDDQYVDLGALDVLSDEAEITGNFEPVVALQAVGEGRATAVQNRWMRANGVSAPEGTEADLLALETVPPAFVLGLSLPYAFGEQFIEGQGGPANTWDLLDNPPASSEEFLVPGATGEAVTDVAPPPADGPVLDDIVFGASDLFTWLLGESLDPDPSLIFPTFAAIDGWAGGRSVLWGDDTESCVRIALVADSKADLDEIQGAIELWAERGNDRSVTVEDDQITATSCAPYVP